MTVDPCNRQLHRPLAALRRAAAVIALVGSSRCRWAVAGHEGSTVIVGLNGLRLLHQAAWRRAARPHQAS
jgi:hypothetical protein